MLIPKTLFAAVMLVTSVQAQVIVDLAATMDTSIFSERTGNSNGGGPNLYVGITDEQGERRSLLAFEDLSQIPPGATIEDVSLMVSVNLGVGDAIDVSLHAVTTAWGEAGSMGTGGGGRGGPAETGDATWISAMVQEGGNVDWQVPGGDFAEESLSSTTMPTSGTVTFPGTPELVATVQGWVDGTAENLGLIMISNTTTPRTAKRFASREADGNSQPMLRVTYTDEGGNIETPILAAGLWFDPDADGDGFNIIESPAPAAKGTASNQITIFFFGYDATGARLWLVSNTLPGPFLLNQTLTFSLLAGGSSGNFQTPAPSAELVDWGTLAVTMDSCTSGTFVLDGADGSKTMNAVQLVPIDGVTCSVAR